MNKIVLSFAFLTFTATICNAQSVTVKSDTVSTVQQNLQNKQNSENQDKNNTAESKTESNNKSTLKSVKQVRSAKPDMSKARGARPPEIERPSGSRIPKGVGKAGGAVRPGKK